MYRLVCPKSFRFRLQYRLILVCMRMQGMCEYAASNPLGCAMLINVNVSLSTAYAHQDEI